MVEVFVLAVIEDVLETLRTDGYPFETWTTRELRKYAGIKYSFIYSLERRGVILRASRRLNGRLIWNPREICDLLSRIKIYIGPKKNSGELL